jgi:hypothetical protein
MAVWRKHGRPYIHLGNLLFTAKCFLQFGVVKWHQIWAKIVIR